MTKREALNYANLSLSLHRLGIDTGDINAMLRIEKTLRRWAERECNGEVEVDEQGIARVSFRAYGTGTVVPNRERGALKRLTTIMARYPKLAAYQQGDPSGCALYVYDRSKVRWDRRACAEKVCTCHDDTSAAYACSSCGCKPLDIDSVYSSIGVAVCL